MQHSGSRGLLAAILLAIPTVPAGAAEKPSDAQIAHIAYTAGDIDIKAAQLALEKSKTDSVRAFATDMVRDHKAVNDKALALVKQLNVTPEDNDTSKGLVKQANDKAAELAKLSGAAFDKTYIANEVAYHNSVNDALATTLIPSAANPELKSLLETGLKIFKAHEQHAAQLAGKLRSSGGFCKSATSLFRRQRPAPPWATPLSG